MFLGVPMQPVDIQMMEIWVKTWTQEKSCKLHFIKVIYTADGSQNRLLSANAFHFDLSRLEVFYFEVLSSCVMF